MSTLWDSLLAQADADDRAALASALVAELCQQLEEAASQDGAPEAMLSPAEVAIRCGVHVETIRRAIRSGRLPAVRIGSRLRVDSSDLERWSAAPEQTHSTQSSPRRHRRQRRAGGVMTQAVKDLYPGHTEKAS